MKNYVVKTIRVCRGRYVCAHYSYNMKEQNAINLLSYANSILKQYPQDFYRMLLGAYQNHWRYNISPMGIFDANTMIKLSV